MTASDGLPYTTRRLATGSISFLIPTNWEVWEPPQDMLFLASAPEDVEPFEAQVSVSRTNVSEDTDCLGLLVAGCVTMRSRLPAYAEEDASTFSTADTNVGRLQYSARIQGYDVRQVDFYVVVERVGYVINCKAVAHDFPRWKSIFDSVGESIRVEVN